MITLVAAAAAFTVSLLVARRQGYRAYAQAGQYDSYGQRPAPPRPVQRDPQQGLVSTVANPSPAPRSRAVMWTGLMLGTALAVLAMTDGVRLKVAGIPAFLGWLLGGLIVWVLVVLGTAGVAELLRRYHRPLARHAGRQARRGARHGWRPGPPPRRPRAGRRRPLARAPVAGPPVRPKAGQRPRAGRARRRAEAVPVAPPPGGRLPAVPGQRQPVARTDPATHPGRRAPGRPRGRRARAPAAAGVTRTRPPTTGRARGSSASAAATGSPYYGGPGGSPAGTVLVHDPEDLQRRLAAAATDPGTEARVTRAKVTDPDLALPALTPALEADVRRQVCDQFAADHLEPGEVIVGADGSVTIDRRRNSRGAYPQARPVTGTLRWAPAEGGGARVVDLFPVTGRTTDPAGGTPPPAAGNTDHQHGGNGMTATESPDAPVGYWPAYTAPGAQRRTARTAAAPEPNGLWKSLISSTSGFEPESDAAPARLDGRRGRRHVRLRGGDRRRLRDRGQHDRPGPGRDGRLARLRRRGRRRPPRRWPRPASGSPTTTPRSARSPPTAASCPTTAAG